MTWKTLVYLADVAALSDSSPAEVTNDAIAGVGTDASRDDHVHIIGTNAVDDSTVGVAAGVMSLKDDGIALAKLGSDLCTANSGIKQHTDQSLMIDFDDTSVGIVSTVLDVKDGSVTAALIDASATDFVFSQIICQPKASPDGSTEGGLYYNSDDDHFYVYQVV